MPTETARPLHSPQEAERLKALADYGVLNTPPDPVLDDLVALLAQICGTPVALISIVDRERVWFKARVGLAATELPRHGSFCAGAIDQADDVFLVPDASLDPRFSASPLVACANGIRFYGGAVLRTPEGRALGTLCIIDHRPRTLTAEQGNALRTLARQVMGRLELGRALRAVTLSEEHFRKLIMSSPYAHYVYVDDRITLVNPAFCELMGASGPDQLLGRSALAVIHPDFRPLVLERRQKRLDGEEVPTMGLKFLRLDGSTVDVEGGGVIFDLHGRREVHVIARDVTARKQAEEELRAKTALLEAQIESSLDGILVVDQQQRKILQNRKCIEVWKIPSEIILDDDDARQVDYVRQRTKNPRQFAERISYLYEHPEETSREEIELVDGTVLDRYSSPIRGKDGRIYGRIWAFRDITDRKNAEKALRASEERFKLVARAVSDVIWDRDMTSGAVWRSESYVKLFGLGSTAADTPTDHWADNIHDQDRARVIRSFKRAIEGRAQTWSEEYRLRRVDGTYADVLNRAQIMRDTDGRALRVVGGMSDLSEQKKLEAQYLRSQRMESIGTLAGGIAHDLNNVLTPILLSIDLLRAEAPAKGGQGQILDAIQSSALRGAGLVRQVLAFARGVDGERLSLNVGHLFRDLERIIGETFPRNIRITTEAAPDLHHVLGDPTQLHQVLLNLAVNARDSMPTGGSLTLTAANILLDDRTYPSHEAHQGPYVMVTVTDTGTGIPPQIRERIFEPFFTTKDVGKGTGLGLSTVHAVVKSHGGFVTFDSEVGRGTAFKIYLPADAGPPGSGSRQPFAAKPTRSRQELVLVVDDEFAIRQVTQQTLEAFGYRVLTANDGAEAVALYTRHAQEIALVITDMMMPVMDGHATIQVLTRLNPSIRIIASSGLNATADVAKASEAGVKYFLGKPYLAEALLNLVRDALDGPPPVRTG